MTAEITPLTNDRLFGHEQAERYLSDAFVSGTLPHGLLISGPRGIGKATLAFQFARRLLSEGCDPQATARRMAAGSHADLLVTEPLFDSKKDEFSSEITVEQARHVSEFLSKTPGESAWRVVIIDSIDQLNANAANAILKILEEPPAQSLLMLISHSPGLLLPTIRSRCQKLRLQPLDERHFARAVSHVLPHVPAERLEALAELSGMAPGLVAEMEAQGALVLYGQMLELLADFPSLDTRKIHAFSDLLATGQVHRQWKLCALLWLRLIERAGRHAARRPPRPVHEDEPAVLGKMAALHTPAIWAAKWQQAADQFSLAARLHLDYKQVMLSFIHSLPSPERLAFDYAA